MFWETEPKLFSFQVTGEWKKLCFHQYKNVLSGFFFFFLSLNAATAGVRKLKLKFGGDISLIEGKCLNVLMKIYFDFTKSEHLKITF